MAAVTLLLIVAGSVTAGAIAMAFLAGSVLREAEADLRVAAAELDAEREAHAQTARLWCAVPSQIRAVVRAEVARKAREAKHTAGGPVAPVHQPIREAIDENKEVQG